MSEFRFHKLPNQQRLAKSDEASSQHHPENLSLELIQSDEHSHTHRCSEPVWTYLPTDTAFDLIQLLRTPRSVLVYYCIADFEHLTPWVNQLQQSEKEIIECSDVVFAQEAELAARAARWHDNVHVFPFGVNLDAFPLIESPNGNGALDVEDSSGPGLLQTSERSNAPTSGLPVNGETADGKY